MSKKKNKKKKNKNKNKKERADEKKKGDVPLPEEAVPQILGGAARFPDSPPRSLEEPKDALQENATPTMINVRSEGLKLDLVLFQNRVSRLTIDYENISKSGELQRWIRTIDGLLSGLGLSLEWSVPQTQGEAARPPVSQPQPPEEEPEEPPREKEELEELPREIDYREIVLRAVDVGLDTLGRDQKHVILGILEDEYGMRETDIPDHPRGFVEVLDALLGPSARLVEREIMSNIRLVRAAPGEDLEAVLRSLKEQRVNPPNRLEVSRQTA